MRVLQDLERGYQVEGVFGLALERRSARTGEGAGRFSCVVAGGALPRSVNRICGLWRRRPALGSRLRPACSVPEVRCWRTKGRNACVSGIKQVPMGFSGS